MVGCEVQGEEVEGGKPPLEGLQEEEEKEGDEEEEKVEDEDKEGQWEELGRGLTWTVCGCLGCL